MKIEITLGICPDWANTQADLSSTLIKVSIYVFTQLNCLKTQLELIRSVSKRKQNFWYAKRQFLAAYQLLLR